MEEKDVLCFTVNDENFYHKIGLSQPALTESFSLKENVDISRIVELFNPKYNLSNETVSDLQTYLSYKSRSQNDNYHNGNIDKKDPDSELYAGRLYSPSCSQFLPSEIRNTLFENAFDIDMVCCAPTIVKCVNEKLNIECSVLNYYINKRNEILNELSNTYFPNHI